MNTIASSVWHSFQCLALTFVPCCSPRLTFRASYCCAVYLVHLPVHGCLPWWFVCECPYCGMECDFCGWNPVRSSSSLGAACVCCAVFLTRVLLHLHIFGTLGFGCCIELAKQPVLRRMIPSLLTGRATAAPRHPQTHTELTPPFGTLSNPRTPDSAHSTPRQTRTPFIPSDTPLEFLHSLQQLPHANTMWFPETYVSGPVQFCAVSFLGVTCSDHRSAPSLQSLHPGRI